MHKGFSAGSYKDMTRVAWLNPQMWAELFLDNGDNLEKELDIIVENLLEYKESIKKRDRQGLEKLLDEVDGDEKTGVNIILKGFEAPIRQIALNAGLEGSVIIDNIRREGKVGYGFDAYNEEYKDMLSAGIVDPTKVTRSALQNAASVASMVLTTESLVADNPDEKEEMPQMPAGGMGY